MIEKTQKAKKIVIIGASGHGSVVLDCVIKEGIYDCIGFLDSSKAPGTLNSGYEILGSEYDLPQLMQSHGVSGAIVAIGDNWIRRSVVHNLQILVPNLEFITTIHPDSTIARDVILGRGSVILAGVRVCASASVGDHCILNTNSILEHDGLMHNYSSMAPMTCVGGNFTLGEFSALCIGAICIENIAIGRHSVIGAGAVVLEDVPSLVLVFGTPAKIVHKRKIGDPYLGKQKKEVLF